MPKNSRKTKRLPRICKDCLVYKSDNSKEKKREQCKYFCGSIPEWLTKSSRKRE